MERRKTALIILNEYEAEATYLNLAMKHTLHHDTPGRAFITEVVYGVVRYQRFLDALIGKYSSVKLKKLSIPVKNILRIGFYQMHFMPKIPDFAILDESVKLCGKFAYKSKGFVNAILRKGALREKWEFPLAVRYSFSDEVADLLMQQYPDRAEEIFKHLNHPLPLTLRYHHSKFSDVLSALSQLEGATSEGDVIYPGDSFSFGESVVSGDFSIQSASSQMAVRVLAPQPGERVLDCCSAPGGKTAYIGELMRNRGEILACELHAHRCELVEKNLCRCGIKNATVCQGDASTMEYEGQFDRVLADVPCSGLGVIGSKPDVKWRDFQFESLISLQKKILWKVADCVKSGGVLVYSTCTINQMENQKQIEAFLSEHPNFSLEPFSEEIEGVSYGERGMAQILPGEKTIGFFIAKMRKE